MKGLANKLNELLRCCRGQSAVEYLVVCGILVATLLAMPSIYHQVGSVLSNKYRSYAFGVAITDPPDSNFDTVEGELREFRDWLENAAFPNTGSEPTPETEILREFEDIIHDL